MMRYSNERYAIMNSEEIIANIAKKAEVVGINLSDNDLWNEYKDHVRSIVTDPLDFDQQEALFELTKGLFFASKTKKDKQLLGFAISAVRSAMESARNRTIIHTEDITIKFPEMFLNRYVQLFKALEGIREPFSHEDFHITYNNKDGSQLKISTDIGTVTWIKPNGELIMNTNLSSNKIHVCIKYFVSGLYQPLDNLEWFKENTKEMRQGN